MSGKRHSETYYKFNNLFLKGSPMPFMEEGTWLDLISELFGEKEYLPAHAACKTAMEQHPDSDVLCLANIQSLIFSNNTEQARIELEKFKDDEGQDIATLLFGIECAEGRTKEALDRQIELLKLRKITPEEFSYGIGDYWDIIKDQGIAAQLASSVEYFGNEAKMMTEIGIFLNEIGEFELAIPIFERSLDIDAYYLKSWHNLANNYYQIDNMDKCIECCEFGSAINPQHTLFHFFKALAFMQQKRMDESITELTTSRQLFIRDLQDGNIPNEYTSEGEVYHQIVIILMLLSECYCAKNDTEKALKALRDAYEIEDFDPELNNQLATLYFEMGDFSSSSIHIDKAIEADPNNKQYLALKVSLQTAKHEFEDALATLDSILKLYPRSQSFLFIKAELALQLEKNELADATYRRLLKLNPKNEIYRSSMLHYFQNIGDEDAVRKLENK